MRRMGTDLEDTTSPLFASGPEAGAIEPQIDDGLRGFWPGSHLRNRRRRRIGGHRLCRNRFFFLRFGASQIGDSPYGNAANFRMLVPYQLRQAIVKNAVPDFSHRPCGRGPHGKVRMLRVRENRRIDVMALRNM